jgi:hypothetical protein
MHEIFFILEHKYMIYLKNEKHGYIDGCSNWILFRVTVASPSFALLTGIYTRLAWCMPIQNLFDVVAK